MTEASIHDDTAFDAQSAGTGDDTDRTAGRVVVAVLLMLGLWAACVVKFGVPGLYLPALGLVPVIWVLLLAITMGK